MKILKKSPGRKPSRYALERELHEQGFVRIGGLDEAGRGPLAGPVCAAVVVFEPGVKIPKVDDSKKLLPELREELFGKIQAKALGVGVGLACAEEIDSINILRATKLAMRRALRQLRFLPDHLLLDALTLENCTIPQVGMVQGDSRCFSIAAASIIAKVTRDRLMVRYAEEFPNYGFEGHKGYATPDHRLAIEMHGPATLHRQTFLPQWFGTASLQHSRTFRELHSSLANCTTTDEIDSAVARFQALGSLLPACERQQLTALARQRHLEFYARRHAATASSLVPAPPPPPPAPEVLF